LAPEEEGKSRKSRGRREAEADLKKRGELETVCVVGLLCR